MYLDSATVSMATKGHQVICCNAVVDVFKMDGMLFVNEHRSERDQIQCVYQCKQLQWAEA